MEILASTPKKYSFIFMPITYIYLIE